jgi:hypothetical protein
MVFGAFRPVADAFEVTRDTFRGVADRFRKSTATRLLIRRSISSDREGNQK